MSTQYDTIGGLYQSAKLAPGARLETHNLNLTLSPLIPNATVLDLACGTGYYSRKLLEWGAASVTGVDISSTMIDFAEESLTPEERERVTFRVGDCAVAESYPGGLFDVVLGSWLLNYAADADEMTAMFRNISRNLKAGGVFVGVCPRPTTDLPTYFRGLQQKPREKFGFDAYIKKEVVDGVVVHTSIYPPGLPAVEFDNYHLRREVWEKAAVDGGMSGPMEWPPLDVPVMTDLGEDYWRGCELYPPFAILTIRK